MLQMSLVLGQTVIVMHHFAEEVYLQSIQEYKVHFLFLLPPVLIMLTNSPSVENYDLSSVEGAMSSGAPASIHICRKALKRLPNTKRIDQGYGMTETSGACTLPIMGNSTVATTHSGVILPNYEMKLVDSDGREVPLGEGGELQLRAPAMMLGYIGRPEATADAFSNGWYKTGDIARIDENGLVYIVGRSKDVIKSQGAQASPTELEDVLLSHPDILDAGVIPVPLEDGDEGFFAFIVRKNDLSKEDIHKFVNYQVAEFKRLRAGINLVDTIPKSDTGKILRNVLKDMYKSRI
uniref:AMP-binding domain-containing protein n=1 Tax=Panagrellus redivivus TaxID=6233 RepID=A0A7E4VC25_PANRE